MTAIVTISIVAILYCAAYTGFCILKGRPKDVAGAAVLCALAAAALLFLVMG